MFKILLLAAVVVCASAQTPCCVPDQFETIIGDYQGFVNAGTPGLSQGFVLLSFDYPGKRIAEYINMTTDGVPFMQKLILDYNKNVMYAIDEKAQTCKATSPPPPLQRCLPDGAKFLGKFFYGSGSNMLNAQSFEIKDPTQQITAVVSLTMDCFVIGELVYGSQAGVNFLATMGWVDTTIGIKDPSVFVPPSYCQQAKVTVAESKVFAGSFMRGKKPGFN